MKHKWLFSLCALLCLLMGGFFSPLEGSAADPWEAEGYQTVKKYVGQPAGAVPLSLRDGYLLADEIEIFGARH